MLQAVILAGGRGTRLRPLTDATPKPMVYLGGFPILGIIIRWLRFYNITDIIIATGYLSRSIEEYFQKGKKWGVTIRYAREVKPLGTAGPLKAIKGLKDNFFLINGDIFTDINYGKLYNFHIQHQSLATLATVKRKISVDYGVLGIGKDQELISYDERPKRFDSISIGINVLHKKCISLISKNESIDIPELVQRMRAINGRIYCYSTNAYWLDIGKIEDFQKAQEIFKRDKRRFFKEMPLKLRKR